MMLVNIDEEGKCLVAMRHPTTILYRAQSIGQSVQQQSTAEPHSQKHA